MAEKINIAKGHAEAIERTAQARAVGLHRVADALQVGLIDTRLSAALIDRSLS